MSQIAHIASGLHDGETLHRDTALVVEDGTIVGLEPVCALATDVEKRWHTGILCPAFADLQANGGGGVMFNDRTDAEGLRQIAQAHDRIGTGSLLPTLITDTPERTRAAVEAARAVIAGGETNLAGLHLEGPHLSIEKKGAHDPGLIRTMGSTDLDFLCRAAGMLPTLLVTVAPESVTPDQICSLSRAGVVVSLGHTNANYDSCRTAFRAGASCVTHLFNAMSELNHRAPGLVGAALDTPGVSIGLIADGIHVDPVAIRLAMRAAPGRIFLVTDAMATAGSDIDRFTLNGRTIRRRDGRLTLEDGTLAGADLEMAGAISIMVESVGCDLETAIAMATSRPASILKDPGRTSTFRSGERFRAVLLTQGDSGTRLSVIG